MNHVEEVIKQEVNELKEKHQHEVRGIIKYLLSFHKYIYMLIIYIFTCMLYVIIQYYQKIVDDTDETKIVTYTFQN